MFNYQLELEDVGYAEETTRKLRIKHRYGDPFISGGDLLLMKPITCHMDFASE